MKVDKSIFKDIIRKNKISLDNLEPELVKSGIKYKDFLDNYYSPDINKSRKYILKEKDIDNISSILNINKDDMHLVKSMYKNILEKSSDMSIKEDKLLDIYYYCYINRYNNLVLDNLK